MGNPPVKLASNVAMSAVKNVMDELAEKTAYDARWLPSGPAGTHQTVERRFQEALISVQHIISLTTVGINEEVQK